MRAADQGDAGEGRLHDADQALGDGVE